MRNLFLLSKALMARISPHFLTAHGVRRVDVRRVLSGLIHVTHAICRASPSVAQSPEVLMPTAPQ